MLLRLPPLLLLLLPLSLSTTTSPVFRTGKDRAVLFAVEKYQNPQLTNLQNPVKNAREIAAELKNRFGFETEVLENPTQAQIIAKLNELTRLYADNADGRHPSDGQLFLFFSGHGMSEDENGYFLPADADPAQPWAKGIAYEIWRPKIDKINCRHILVALDACYSVRFDPDWKNRSDGQFKRPGEMTDAQKALANYEQYTARVFFTSDNKEDQTPDRSNFARKLLEGLRTAPMPAGYLTSSRLFANYVQEATPTPRAGTFGSDQPSSAFLWYDTHPPAGGAPSAPAPKVDIPAETDLDLAIWTKVHSENTLESYNYYIKSYPSGRFLSEAFDERAWLEAVARNNAMDYEQYIRSYPKGHHCDEAKTRAAGLTDTAIAAALKKNMIPIPGGTFEMGSSNGDKDERPVHKVTVKPFLLSRYEVTAADFMAFTRETGYILDFDKNTKDSLRVYKPGGWIIIWYASLSDKEKNGPMTSVSWNDAAAYCRWLSQKTGQTYRLPTEAEWEYAAGNGAKHTKYSWGDRKPVSGKSGNVADKTAAEEFRWNEDASNIFMYYLEDTPYWDGYATTSPVGSFEPNTFGLYDMTGNVAEWCSDWYDSYLSGAQTDPKGPSSGVQRVYRGGSWYSNKDDARITYRKAKEPAYNDNRLGFRVARSE